MITILLCSRSRGNSNLLHLFENFAQTITRPEQVNVLVKMDDDDPVLEKTLEGLRALQVPFAWSHIVSTRGRGYLDLHKGYNDLYLLSSPQTKLYWVVADDIEIRRKGWDQELLEAHAAALKKFSHPYFVLHQDDFNWGCSTALETVIERPESWPIWTKEWINCIGSVGMTMATDAWTAAIETEAMSRHNMDLRHILPHKVVFRKMSEEDMPGGERWENIRSKMLAEFRSEKMRELVTGQADNLAARIQALKSSSTLSSAVSSLEESFAKHGDEFMLQEAFRRRFANLPSVSAQALELSHMVKRHVFPAFQRDPDWPFVFFYLMTDVFNEVKSETNETYSIALLAEMMRKMVVTSDEEMIRFTSEYSKRITANPTDRKIAGLFMERFGRKSKYAILRHRVIRKLNSVASLLGVRNSRQH